MLTSTQAIRLARKHLATKSDMNSSARVALADAIRLHDEGKLDYAKWRALDSIAFSVGVFHPDYVNLFN